MPGRFFCTRLELDCFTESLLACYISKKDPLRLITYRHSQHMSQVGSYRRNYLLPGPGKPHPNLHHQHNFIPAVPQNKFSEDNPIQSNPIEPTIMSSSKYGQKKQTRLRREYLYRKSLQGAAQASYEHKRAVRNALAAGTPLPTEVRASYDKLKVAVDAEDVRTAEIPLTAAVDDEYGDMGVLEPRVCVTTSRDPSSRLAQFAKEIKLLFPNAVRINRGNSRVDELIGMAKTSDFSDIIVLQETRGEPDGMVVCHLPLGPTAYFSISNTVLRHDLENVAPMSEAYPHLILEGFTTPLGQRRLCTIFKALFPVPKPDSQRIVSLINTNDNLSFRHHVFSKTTHDSVTLHEVGPRFELKLYQIRLGTMEQTEADNEYVLRPYQNTAKSRNAL
jgi:U3 small nucleolar ribonucleoprotein protein IMP4